MLTGSAPVFFDRYNENLYQPTPCYFSFIGHGRLDLRRIRQDDRQVGRQADKLERYGGAHHLHQAIVDVHPTRIDLPVETCVGEQLDSWPHLPYRSAGKAAFQETTEDGVLRRIKFQGWGQYR